MSRRRKATGYSVGTLRRRIEEIAEECLKMDQDGRLESSVAHETRALLMMALNVVAGHKGDANG